MISMLLNALTIVAASLSNDVDFSLDIYKTKIVFMSHPTFSMICQNVYWIVFKSIPKRGNLSSNQRGSGYSCMRSPHMFFHFYLLSMFTSIMNRSFETPSKCKISTSFLNHTIPNLLMHINIIWSSLSAGSHVYYFRSFQA